MKLSFSVVALFAALVATTAAAPIPIPQNVAVPTTASCKRIDIRRNIADLTTAQRDTFFNAIQKLKDTPDPTLGDASIYDKYVKMHIDYQIEGHGNSQFIPWHRLFIREFELDLQKVEPSVVLPYWDWSVSSQAPERSIVFTQAYLGGTGSGTSKCVTSGRFANWQVRYPQRGCLQRNFDGGDKIGAFTAPELLDEMIYQSNSYEDFTTKLEYGVHGRVHNGVGGTMSQMQSNSDPIFYLHHANVDRMWSMYQSRSDRHAVEYNGQRPANRGAANLDDILTPFNKTVREALNIVNNLCYTYTKQDIPTPVVTPTATPTVAVPVVTPTPTHVAPTPAVPTRVITANATPTPATPTPAVPTPATPTPAIPTPATPTPAIPTPATPTPAIPTPAVPTPAITTSAIPTPATATPVTTPATPQATPTGTAATPIPTGTAATPIPTGTAATPIPTGTAATPIPGQPTPVPTPSSTPVPNLVDCFDRSNMEQIRMPATIPPSWLQMSHLVLDKYTAEEAILLQKVLKYNSLPFSSVGALQYYRDEPTYDVISQRVYEAYGVPVPDANTIHLTAPIGKVSFLTAGGVTAPDGGSHVNPQNLPVAADPNSRTSGASSSVVAGIPLAASLLAAVVLFRL